MFCEKNPKSVKVRCDFVETYREVKIALELAALDVSEGTFVPCTL